MKLARRHWAVVWGILLAVLAMGHGTAAAARAELPRVATFRLEITPPLGSPLCGGAVPPLAAVDDPLWAKGLVLEFEGTRVVLVACDYCEIRNGSHTELRRQLAEAAQTQPNRVAVQSLHQHNAPIVDQDAQRLLDASPATAALMDLAHWRQICGQMAEAVSQAKEKLQPFDAVGLGAAQVDRVASSRRARDARGRLHIRWSSNQDEALRSLPEGLIDPWVRTITLAHQGRPLVRLHYYATHPQSYYGDGRVTSDIPGLAREQLEREEGVPQIYFTGCAGDVTAGKYNDGSPRARVELVERLAQGLRHSIAATELGPVGPIEWRVVPIVFPPRLEREFSEDEARRKLQSGQGSALERINAAFLLALLERRQTPFELSALRLGDARLVHLPGEPFVIYQLEAERWLPGQLVAVAGYADGATGYLCTEASFAEGGYEPTASLVGPRSQQVLDQGLRALLLGSQPPELSRQ